MNAEDQAEQQANRGGKYALYQLDEQKRQRFYACRLQEGELLAERAEPAERDQKAGGGKRERGLPRGKRRASRGHLQKSLQDARCGGTQVCRKRCRQKRKDTHVREHLTEQIEDRDHAPHAEHGKNGALHGFLQGERTARHPGHGARALLLPSEDEAGEEHSRDV